MPLSKLSPREREIAQLVAHDLSNLRIARRLGISEHTVKTHVQSIHRKLGTTSRSEVAISAAGDASVLLERDRDLVVDMGDRTTVTATGPLDATRSQPFIRVLLDATRSGRPVDLDLGEVSVITSHGVRAILEAVDSLAVGQQLSITSASPQTERALELAGLDRYLAS